MADPTRTAGSFGPGVVTPSDTADIPQVNGFFPRALRVHGAGDIRMMAPDGTYGVFTCTGPEVLPAQVKRVMATGTTITGAIVPLY